MDNPVLKISSAGDGSLLVRWWPNPPGFLEEWKNSIPPDCRRWDPDQRCWVVLESGVPSLNILILHYGLKVRKME